MFPLWPSGPGLTVLLSFHLPTWRFLLSCPSSHPIMLHLRLDNPPPNTPRRHIIVRFRRYRHCCRRAYFLCDSRVKSSHLRAVPVMIIPPYRPIASSWSLKSTHYSTYYRKDSLLPGLQHCCVPVLTKTNTSFHHEAPIPTYEWDVSCTPTPHSNLNHPLSIPQHQDRTQFDSFGQFSLLVTGTTNRRGGKKAYFLRAICGWVMTRVHYRLICHY